ncbi:hypothetical protein F4860DRAFT_112173 [Xylaria cubensis]|nr:hypothetical protein F4860DRAFT_112173 [Xylaria cubensis]
MYEVCHPQLHISIKLYLRKPVNMARTTKSRSETHPKSRPSSSIKPRKITVKQTLRTRPLIPPTRFRYLNEYNFPNLAQTWYKIIDEDESGLPEEDRDYQPTSPSLSGSSPSPQPSPSLRAVSPISIPESIENVSYFGLEIITRPSTPETPQVASPSMNTSSTRTIKIESPDPSDATLQEPTHKPTDTDQDQV